MTLTATSSSVLRKVSHAATLAPHPQQRLKKPGVDVIQEFTSYSFTPRQLSQREKASWIISLSNTSLVDFK